MPCRTVLQCAGETDTSPTGAVGKMSQLLFAVLSPHHAVPNLMSANIAAAGAVDLSLSAESPRPRPR
jgi:hypothetical protein